MADSFIRVSHVTKTRHAHQVTAAAIHTLLHRTYDEHTSESTTIEEAVMSFEEWCATRAQRSTHFDYRLKTLLLEILLLLYIRALREGDSQLYVEALTKVVPWMFVLDHTHYARWLPVHIRDMMILDEEHPPDEQPPTDTPVVDIKCLDGVAIVQMLSPGPAKTLQEYADMVFVPYIVSQLKTARRVDVIWDVYIPKSLKGTTRENPPQSSPGTGKTSSV